MLERIAHYFGTSIDYLMTGRFDTHSPVDDYQTNDILQSDLTEAIRILPPEVVKVLVSSGKKLSSDGWRSVVDYIKWRIAQEEPKE